MGIKSILSKLDIFTTLEDIKNDVKSIKECNLSRKNNIQKFKEELAKQQEQQEKERNVFLTVIDHLEDMVWAKDKAGRYIMANKAFREKFCYGMSWEELKDKTDYEIAAIFKNKVGTDNHTFGETCIDSDEVVFKTAKAREFLEQGKINGKLVKLVVNKSPVYQNGIMFAICGTGKDVTEQHDQLEKIINSCSACLGAETRDLLIDELNKLEFKED